MSAPLRLTVDTSALAANWRWFGAQGGVAAGAAVKADGYGLGAREAVAALAAAGCRDFFVATWAEAAALTMPAGTRLAVLHGLLPGETPLPGVVPVLNSLEQVARWVDSGGGRCDLMVDTGMNRLGLNHADLAQLPALDIDVLHSHIACADEPGHPLNAAQLARFHEACAQVPHARAALANSAGVCLGTDYAFDLTRPGIGLYGGVMHPAAAGQLQTVAGVEARVVQVRDIAAGETFGYGATWAAPRASRVAILNLGYADGYRRAFSGVGRGYVEETPCPVVGRVSMDLTGIDVTGHDVREGDWLRVDFDLAAASALSGIAQYELLTGLGHRYQRRYV
ncbi:alanine racemase [Glacieibacterium frigidum]|uniref:Alanine racemase n=1 Tax=Glacieibacterium frigidum TaxID=2593303 RepID=A0A552UFG7_9SPHN|nr:alanine racemase [Glacieibacterium frigidum]TRW16931.1 alanine racemase [Glacieibacterium frigidum]